MNILAVIPARGGSKGIPRKNIRLLLSAPLISYCIQNALSSSFGIDVVVSTDDDEISRIADLYGATIVHRPDNLSGDSVTLDPVVHHATIEMEKTTSKHYDIVVTLQPTSPLLKTKTLDSAISYFIENNHDTVLSGINKPHLSWKERNGSMIPNYKERLNRQFLPKELLETGAFLISKREHIRKDSRFGPDVSVYEVPENESIDIDSPHDWWVAEKELSKKNILIRVEGYSEIGLGHIYRALLLADNLIEHNVRFVLSEQSDLGIKKIKASHYPYSIISDDSEIFDLIEDYNTNILIHDMLDTKMDYMKKCKSTGIRVVNFEDLGEGAQFADAVVNDLYEKKNNLDNHYWGSDYYCIRDEFHLAKPTDFREEVNEILVIFGGTDPCNLSKRLLDVVKSIGDQRIRYSFILGLGYKEKAKLMKDTEGKAQKIFFIQDVKNMAEYMANADIAISSQGRTMFELASMGVPTILLAQNERELHHEFGNLGNGFINLGLGSEVKNETIKQTLLWLINSSQIRKQMRDRMLKDDLKKGIFRVKNIILGTSVV